MQSIERTYLSIRRARLLSGLSGRVLEIGVGTGTNFEHYRPDTELLGFEPSIYMLKRARFKMEASRLDQRSTLLQLGCGDPEVEHLIKPESLDGVVCTLVLCSIPDPETALRNYFRWLKPGGKLIILQHIRSHKPSRARWQDILTPTWKLLADGCHLNRPTDKFLIESGFQLVREERFRIGLPFYEAEFIRPPDGRGKAAFRKT